MTVKVGLDGFVAIGTKDKVKDVLLGSVITSQMLGCVTLGEYLQHASEVRSGDR